jgi:hypothetical protein
MKREALGRPLRDAVRLERRLLPRGAPLAGRIVRRVSRRVEVFCRIDAHSRYDAVHIAPDDAIAERDVQGANVIGAGILLASWESVTRLGTLPELAAIPRDTDLLDADDAAWAAALRPAVAQLFDRLAAIPHVETPRLTKVLYLKRPALVPVCDATLLHALTGAGVCDPAAGLRVLDLLRRVGRAHAAPLARAAAFAAERGFPGLSRVRVLEAALSMEADGRYDPLWESLGWSSWVEPEEPALRLFDDA